jgi:hypothetical protein
LVITLEEAKSKDIVPLPTCNFLLVASHEILASVVDDVDESVRVGVLVIGLVKVLLVKVSVPARVTNVPVVGSVILVEPVVVKVSALAPDVVRFPPKVIVEA